MRLIDADELTEEIKSLTVTVGGVATAKEFKTSVLRIIGEQPTQNAVVLPCKVGDTIYVIPSDTNFRLNKMYHTENNRVYKPVVESFLWCNNNDYVIKSCNGLYDALDSELGITWFLTYDEAEQALNQLEQAQQALKEQTK